MTGAAAGPGEVGSGELGVVSAALVTGAGDGDSDSDDSLEMLGAGEEEPETAGAGDGEGETVPERELAAEFESGVDGVALEAEVAEEAEELEPAESGSRTGTAARFGVTGALFDEVAALAATAPGTTAAAADAAAEERAEDLPADFCLPDDLLSTT